MNIAESHTDINADIDNEDYELVTSDLKGDKIERLLYKSGFDSEHKEGEEGITVLEIRGDTVKIVMSETWEADGMWYIDPASVVLDVFDGEEFSATYFPDDIETEEDLVEYVDNVIGSLLG